MMRESRVWIDVDSWKLNPNLPLVFELDGLVVSQSLAGKYSGGVAYGSAMQSYVRLTPTPSIYYFVSKRCALDATLGSKYPPLNGPSLVSAPLSASLSLSRGLGGPRSGSSA
jgi:hypothetical protein